MVDGKTYDGVVELFLKDNWHKASCAISAYEGGVFISACALGVTRPFTMRMDIATFVKIADVLRQHLPDEDEGIEDCDDMDIDDMIFNRLEFLEERVSLLEKKLVANGRHSGGYYVMEFPSDIVSSHNARLVNF